MTQRAFNTTLIYLSCLLPLTLHCYGQGIKKKVGETLFIQHCSRCHGIKGAGGEGPALNRYYLPRASNDTIFGEVILDGIPGTGMPGNWALSTKDVADVIKFVRGLNVSKEELARGNAQRGAILFEKSGCYSCHVIGQKGISIGPELAKVGSRRGGAYIREAIINPGRQKILDEGGFISYLVIDVTLRDGKTIKGIRLNEDTFTLQLKDTNNQIYSLRKSDVKTIQRKKDASLMPTFSASLSVEELDDMVAFLVNRNE